LFENGHIFANSVLISTEVNQKISLLNQKSIRKDLSHIDEATACCGEKI